MRKYDPENHCMEYMQILQNKALIKNIKISKAPRLKTHENYRKTNTFKKGLQKVQGILTTQLKLVMQASFRVTSHIAHCKKAFFECRKACSIQCNK